MAAEVGALLAMHDCVEWYAAQGQQVWVCPAAPIEEPAAPEPAAPLVAEPPAPVPTRPETLAAGELWAVRDALANVEGLGIFRKIQGD
jgi:hypothetical protein